MRIGILGGSFDPVHNGHLIVAQLLREALALDRVLLMVAAEQPLKGRHGARAADRLRMVELAVAGIPGLVADGREVARGGPSYTIDTLRELAAQGSAVLLFTSELTEIPLVCDRVVVLHQGRISDRLPAAEATEARLLRSAHGLVEAEVAG